MSLLRELPVPIMGAAFLTAFKPRKTAGSDECRQRNDDQVIAQEIRRTSLCLCFNSPWKTRVQLQQLWRGVQLLVYKFHFVDQLQRRCRWN